MKYLMHVCIVLLDSDHKPMQILALSLDLDQALNITFHCQQESAGLPESCGILPIAD